MDRVGPDRTEAIRSGPRSKGMSWIGQKEFFFYLLYVARSCHEARHDRATTLPSFPLAVSTFHFPGFFLFHFSFSQSPGPPSSPSPLHAFLACPAPTASFWLFLRSSLVSRLVLRCSVLVPRPRYRYSLSHSLWSLSLRPQLRASDSHSLTLYSLRSQSLWLSPL